MDDIKAIVQSITSKCASFGCEVSETLAAFIARTVVFDNKDEFRMDKDMTEDDINRLVQLSVEQLLQVDSPSLETIKMQVAFDTIFVQKEEEIEDRAQTKINRSAGLKRTILDTKTQNSSDFENLTVLYRQIFQLLLIQSDVAASGNRAVEREIAAALESVFPRAGLNSFIKLTAEEKKNQLQELINIVTGIRLFNRELGKGGVGLEDVAGTVRREVVSLKSRLQNELQEITDICQQYTDVLLYVQIHKSEDANSTYMTRWQEELTNRRQFLKYVQSLLEDITTAQDRTLTSINAFSREMSDLELLIGSKTSVPKELVYPKFDSLAMMYQGLVTERDLVLSREASWKVLHDFKSTCESTLSAHIVTTARSMGQPNVEQLRIFARGISNEIKGVGVTESKEGSSTSAPECKSEEEAPTEAPVRLSIKSTPEFMQLPLEYQGYCPWTIVHRNGLLLPGNPGLGVVRYRNSFNVFMHEESLTAFMANPEFYVEGVLSAARKNTELIHLLRLQDNFPEASLQFIISGAKRGRTGVHALLSPTPTKMVDKGTETPVHFVEKHIDPNYEWNEWSLRRKALQMANLRNSKTISAQTDASHFRRNGETQVYLPKIKSTQTGISKGTNPIRVKNYITGLRGGKKSNKGKLTKFAKSSTNNPSGEEYKAAVVSLSLEL